MIEQQLQMPPAFVLRFRWRLFEPLSVYQMKGKKQGLSVGNIPPVLLKRSHPERQEFREQAGKKGQREKAQCDQTSVLVPRTNWL